MVDTDDTLSVTTLTWTPYVGTETFDRYVVLRSVVENMASGALQWEQCISHRIGFAEAPDLFQHLNEGTDGGIFGAVISWRN